MKTSKVQKTLLEQANSVIHRRNLYICLQNGGGNRRVINAHIAKTGNPVPCVEDLYTGEEYALAAPNKFQDGYGQEVVF